MNRVAGLETFRSGAMPIQSGMDLPSLRAIQPRPDAVDDPDTRAYRE
mgnify:CR=1 FL=1